MKTTQLRIPSLVLAVVVVAAVCPAPVASAQDLYSMSGVSWETIPGSRTVDPVGIDQAGSIYQDLKSFSETTTPFSCYYLSDPDGTAAKPVVEQGGYRLAMAHDLGTVAAFRYSPSPVQLYLCDCAGGGSCAKQWEYETVLPNLGKHKVDNLPGRMLMTPDGVPCIITFEGLNCAVPNPGPGEVEWTLRIDFAWLEANLPLDPGLAWHALYPGATLDKLKTQWDLLSVAWHPNGRMFALVSVQYYTTENQSGWLPFIIEQHEDGTADMVTRPPRPPVPGPRWYWGDAHTPLTNPFDYATQILYEPTLDALVAWPVGGMEYNHTPMYDPQQMLDYAAGRGGFGIYVIPTEGTDTGYMSLMHGRLDGKSRAPLTSVEAIRLPDGGIAFPIEKIEAGILHKLNLDLDRLDLDTDGLSYNLERELGTSDYTIESDRGSTIDSVEAQVTRTDPTDIVDDPAPIRNQRLIYVESAMIRGFFDDLGIEDLVRNGLISGTSGSGPLCFQNGNGLVECLHEDRATRSTFPFPSSRLLRFSQDGTFALFQTDEGVFRVQLDSGDIEKVLEWGAVALACGVEALDSVKLDFFPAGPEHTFVTCYWSHQVGQDAWDEYFVVSFRDGEEGELLYDHQKARCDSGLGLCDPSLAEWKEVKDGTVGKLYPHDLLFTAVGSAGYIPELDRFLMTVAGSWGRYYVGLSPDHDPTVLVGPNDLQGGMKIDYMAKGVQPTGYGDYYTGYGFMDGWLNNRVDAWIQFTSPPAMFWNGFSVSVDSDGSMWENVRYEGNGDPGDVLLLALAPNTAASMIYRSGPRGGLAHAWDEPYPFYSALTPYGIDVSPDHLLCITHRRGWYNDSAVSVMESSAPWAVPSGLIMEIGELGDVTDCHWGDDGTLYLLNADPPRIERLPEFWVEAMEVVQELPGESEPIDLVVKPDGTFEYVDRNGPLRGLYYLSDGRRIEVPMSDFIVRIDGRQSVNLNRIIYGVYGVPVADSAHTFIRFQERADGLVVAVPFGCEAPQPIGGTAFIFDPDTDELWQLSSSPVFPGVGNGLALMPDGADADPWGPAGGAVALVGPEGPAPIETPMYGYPATRNVGCSAGPGAGSGHAGLVFLLAVLFVLLTVRRWSVARLQHEGEEEVAAVFCLAFVAVALACCGSGADDGGFLTGNTGEGPSNVESLMPMEVGTRVIVQDGPVLYHAVISEGFKRDGKEWRREERDDGTVLLWVKGSFGWGLAADNSGTIDPPVVPAPHKVKVGMEWSSGPVQFEVVSRSMESTPWGRRLTWGIYQVGAVDAFTSYYVEGRGWWKDDDDYRVIGSFRAEEEPEIEPATAAELKLEPVMGADGKQLVLDLEGSAVAAIEDEPGSVVMALFGVSWGFLGGSWILVNHRRCVRIDDTTVQNLSVQADATGFLVETNGICLGAAPEYGSVGEPDFDHYDVAPWISADGAAYYYAEPPHDSYSPTDFQYLVGSSGEDRPTLLRSLTGDLVEAPWGNTAYGKMKRLSSVVDPREALSHFDSRAGVAFAPMRAEGEGYPLGHITNSGTLLLSEWRKGRETTQPLPLFYSGFEAVITTTRQGRHAIIAHPNDVDELTWEQGAARLRRVAAFKVPDNHFVTGAVRQGDNLIVTTGNRVDGANVWNGTDARKTYLWRLDAPTEEGVDLKPPATLAVSAMVSGADVVVCWPKTVQVLDPTGWTLGGAPAVTVRPAYEEGNCALVVRDFENAEDSWLNGGGLLTGKIPGIGPMEIVVPPGPTKFRKELLETLDYALNELWPTPDGGFVGLGKHFDPNGLQMRNGPKGLDPWFGVQDAAGYGHWRIEGNGVELATSWGESVVADKEWPSPNGPAFPTHRLLGQVAGGGVIVSSPDPPVNRTWKVAPDGVVTELPEAVNYSFESAVVTSDGVFCTVYGSQGVKCIDSEGVAKGVEPVDPMMNGARLYPLNDGRAALIPKWDNGAWIIDPEKLTATQLDAEFAFRGNYNFGLDGALYFVPVFPQNGSGGAMVGTPGPDSRPYELTSTGAIPLSLPDYTGRGGYQAYIYSFLPASDFFFVFLANGSFLRVPR
jgi:hypothetical protein